MPDSLINNAVMAQFSDGDFSMEFNLLEQFKKKRDGIKRPLSKWQVLFEAEMKALKESHGTS